MAMPAPPQTLVLFAVPQEARPFRKFVIGRPEVRVRVTGIGARRAEAAVREELLRSLPDRVLTCGFAGGLNPVLQCGALVGQWDETWAEPDRLTAAGFTPGRFLCVERIVSTAREKGRLREQTGADAVEMESGFIIRVCREHGVPAATLRVISDAADEDLPLDFNALGGPDADLRYSRLALALARSPGKIADLVRFRRRVTTAATTLAAALGRVIGTQP